MSCITKIPLDIWGEILVRLPAESLIRSRAVCKGLRAVIDDPCFVRAHTNYNHQQHSSKIIFQKQTSKFPSAVGSCFSLDLEALISCSGDQAVAATPLDLDFISCTPHGLSLPVVACDGLVLTQKPLTIWNPLTHERLELPPTGDFSISSAAFGLGYDGTTDDYKAVVILSSRDTHVYSLKRDSWRRIMNCPCESYSWGPLGPGVFVCGALNWVSKGKEGAYEDKIVALDLGTEKYSLLQIPHQTRSNKPESLNKTLINELDGRLALCDRGYNSHLDVWVMKDYGDEDSWIKLFSIGNEQNNISLWDGYLRPVSLFMKERIVFLQDGCFRFFLFNVETKSLKYVEINDSIIEKDSYWYAKQMFAGTIFRLHANCGGGGGGKIATSSTNNKKKKASSLKWLKQMFAGTSGRVTFSTSLLFAV